MSQYVLLDHISRIFPLLSHPASDFASDRRLDSSRFILSEPVERGLEDVAQLVLQEQLGDTALPTLFSTFSEILQFLRLSADGTRPLEDRLGSCSISIVDSLACLLYTSPSPRDA